MAERKLSTVWEIKNYAAKYSPTVVFESGELTELQHESLPGLKWSARYGEALAPSGFADLWLCADFGRSLFDVNSVRANVKTSLLDEKANVVAKAGERKKVEFTPLGWEHGDANTAKAFKMEDVNKAVHENGSLRIRIDLKISKIAIRTVGAVGDVGVALPITRLGTFTASSDTIYYCANPDFPSLPEPCRSVLTLADGQVNELITAARHGNADSIKRLISGGIDTNAQSILGFSALHVAAFHGNLNVVKTLISEGADVNVADQYSSAAKIAGLKNLSESEVQFLREEAFKSQMRLESTYRGCTALHYAVFGNHLDVVRFLLESGADPTAVNEADRKATDYSNDIATMKELQAWSKKFQKEREAEQRRLYPLDRRLKERLVGQEGAIHTVATAIRRKENGWYDEDHPLVFLFLGSSGIGKTELVKQVAKYLHKDDQQGFIRMDMSEYQEMYTVSKFIGSPPGYVGHDKGGQLTKLLSECPSAVVLFDEVEKAHPDVLTIMLQLFDEGRLTDGQGKTVECKNAIFFMTSNLASSKIADHAVTLRKETAKFKNEKDNDMASENIQINRSFKDDIVQPILKRHFRRDEFLGRINEMVYFLPFSRSELCSLVAKELDFWTQKAFKAHCIELSWESDVMDLIADGYNVRYGARSIKHEVERRIVNKLAAAHEQRLIGENAKVRLYVEFPVANVSLWFLSFARSKQTPNFEAATIELEVTDNGEPRKVSVPLPDRVLNAD